ncbi:MAG: hypothetical protein HRT86_01880 [Ilumatobacteraceae bacterium]|nr:hypothetical protein [Ilumatobacteraceae bacterium]
MLSSTMSPSTDGAIGGSMRRSIVASSLGKVVELVTLVALATIVPRALGPADYGRFAVVLTVVTMVSLALTLGGPTLMTRYVPAAPPDERVPLALALGRRLLVTRAAMLSIGAVAALGVATTTSLSLTDTSIAIVASTLHVVATIALLVLLGLGGTTAWAVRFPFHNAVLVIAALVLYPVGGVTASLIAILIAAIATTLAALIVAAPVLRAHPTGDVQLPSGALHFGALQAGGAALMQYTHRAGVLAVAIFAGSSVETGYAALAIGLALGATYAVLQLFTVSLPHLTSGDLDREGTERAEAPLRRLALAATALLVPVLAAAALLLDWLVPPIFGTDYEGAETAFVPALALVVLAPLYSLYVQVAAVRLRPRVTLECGIVAAVLFTIVAVVTTPSWNAVGGTTAALVGSVGAVLVALVRMRPMASFAQMAATFGGAGIVIVAGLIGT